jgi:thiol-disulfide isomerase/thioredoxin
MLKNTLFPLAVLSLLAACGNKPEPPAAVTAETPPAPSVPAAPVAETKAGDIAWFQGSIDAAFAAAAEQHKQVFLYWGAVWCPPCHELKAYVFSRPDFREKLKQFIPVYLDGDAPGAQKVGEEFAVRGYPTVLVLRADRTEVARIAGGMDLSRYAEVLDLALENARPMQEIFASLQANSNSALSLDDCRRLAFNGWILDRRADDPGPLASALSRAAARCPKDAQLEHDRLIVSATDFAARDEVKRVAAGKPPSDLLRSLVKQVNALVGDSKRALRNADVFAYLGKDYFVVASKASAKQRAQLLDSWIALLDALVSDQRYAAPLRLDAVALKLEATSVLGTSKKVPAALTAEAHRTLDEFLARPYDEHAHVSMINAALSVTEQLDDKARTRAILEEEIKHSKTPYYYMVDLGDLEDEEKRPELALQWYQRAYDESQGPATRFQWGMMYLDGLLRLSPDDQLRIQTATSQVLSELDGADRIHQRTRTRLDRLNKSLHDWAKKPGRADTLTAITTRWQEICAKMPASDPVSKDCTKLLSG